MSGHTNKLQTRVGELFAPERQRILQEICTSRPLDDTRVIDFDESLGGPSILRVVCGGQGRYEAEDRDVFRPLQYCSIHFHPAYKQQDLEWQTRDVVEMSSLHIENLIKRIGGVRHLPLGQALRKKLVKLKVDKET